jgi:hypothetical protein
MRYANRTVWDMLIVGLVAVAWAAEAQEPPAGGGRLFRRQQARAEREQQRVAAETQAAQEGADPLGMPAAKPALEPTSAAQALKEVQEKWKQYVATGDRKSHREWKEAYDKWIWALRNPEAAKDPTPRLFRRLPHDPLGGAKGAAAAGANGKSPAARPGQPGLVPSEPLGLPSIPGPNALQLPPMPAGAAQPELPEPDQTPLPPMPEPPSRPNGAREL